MKTARATPERRVLIVGLDPDAVPGIDVAAVRAGLAYGSARFDDSDLVADQCLVPLDATAERRIIEALTSASYDAPGAAIAFNTDGGTSLEAALRVLAPPPE